ncbi:hypothetical protein COU74_05310 [Candidatus Peregrinibacteria bacterium CG10_big_fil_rev_8_21_14_0_10_36_19]|nr:MAG: hypothetical protein COU74_05310 [Candidatus Peregrinibacteria bacterium CG10_big_fil_rev_8_21_14_0_10_36_19]
MNSKVYIVLALIIGLAIGYFATSSELFKGFLFFSPNKSINTEKAGFDLVNEEVPEGQMINIESPTIQNNNLERGSIQPRNRALTQ